VGSGVAAGSLKQPSGAASVVSGVLFLVAAVLAVISVVNMSTFRGMSAMVSRFGFVSGFPFDWYVLFLPQMQFLRGMLTGAIVTPVVVLAVCGVAALVLGRRAPRAAVLAVAVALSVQNVLLAVPLWTGAPAPWYGVRMGLVAHIANSAVGAGVVWQYGFVLVLPVLAALCAAGAQKIRRVFFVVFLVVAGVYVVGYLAVLRVVPPNDAYVLTPGYPALPGTYLAPLATIACLVAMVLVALSAVRRSATRQPKSRPSAH